MTIAELLTAIGNDRVAVQYLDQCATAMNYNAKSGTKITFGTDAALTPNGTDKLGIIVWLDREQVKSAIAQFREPTP